MSDNLVGTAILLAIGILLVLSDEDSENLSPEAAQPVVVEPEEIEAEPAKQAPGPKPSLPEGLKLLNMQRQQRGLGPLVLDPALQAGAESKASIAATKRHSGHIGGTLYGASKEGVGYGSSRAFRACYAYTAPAGTPVGAAIRQGSDGRWYCCLLVQYSGALAPSNATNTRYRRRLFR